MPLSSKRTFFAGLGTVCALCFGTMPAYAGNDFSPDAKAQFTADIVAFTNARPNGLRAAANACGQMRASLEAYGRQMPKWAVSGETDLCDGIDGLNSGTNTVAACKTIGKAEKTFDKVNVRAEDNMYIYTYISFTAAIQMVQRENCAG